MIGDRAESRRPALRPPPVEAAVSPRAAERPMLTAEQVAGRWGVNIKTVYAAIRAGQLPAVRLGRTLRIPAAVVASIEARGVKPDGDPTR